MSWRRKKIFLVDEIFRGRPATHNIIVAVSNAPHKTER